MQKFQVLAGKFSRNLWQVPLNDIARGWFFIFLVLKVVAAAVRAFDRDKCSLRASALTFYCLLSIVPVVAMTLGIAKGFGLEGNLQELLFTKTNSATMPNPKPAKTPLVGTAGETTSSTQATVRSDSVDIIGEVIPGQQKEAIKYIVSTASKFLQSMGSGIFAGVSTAILFWIVIRLLVNIEDSFNDIWKVQKGRSFARRISDYLSMTVIGSVLIVAAGSMTVFISGHVGKMTEHIILLGDVTRFLLRVVPYAVVWILFTFLYMLMPNKRISIKSGLIAGIIAGTVYQLVQWAYVRFQIGVGKYNAVYGSVAALPLFLIWLQTSWLIVLFGAEVSYAIDDKETYEPKREYSQASLRFRRLLALRIAELSVKRFVKGEPPATSLEFCHQMGAPLPLVCDALSRLVEAGILAQVKRNGDVEDYYQPAQSARRLKIITVFDALDRLGNDKDHIINEGEFDAIAAPLDRMLEALAQMPENVTLESLESPQLLT